MPSLAYPGMYFTDMTPVNLTVKRNHCGELSGNGALVVLTLCGLWSPWLKTADTDTKCREITVLPPGEYKHCFRLSQNFGYTENLSHLLLRETPF